MRVRVSHETRETRVAAREENAPLLSRALSHACGHFPVARVSLDGLRKKRSCS